MHRSSSKIGPFWSVTGLPIVSENSSLQSFGADYTESLVSQNCLHSRDSPPEIIDSSPLKALPRQSENLFSSFSSDV